VTLSVQRRRRRTWLERTAAYEVGVTGRSVQKLHANVPRQECDGAHQSRRRPSEPNGGLCKALHIDHGDERTDCVYPAPLFHLTQKTNYLFKYSHKFRSNLCKKRIVGAERFGVDELTLTVETNDETLSTDIPWEISDLFGVSSGPPDLSPIDLSPRSERSATSESETKTFLVSTTFAFEISKAVGLKREDKIQMKEVFCFLNTRG
jgi:hypothetical protein